MLFRRFALSSARAGHAGAAALVAAPPVHSSAPRCREFSIKSRDEALAWYKAEVSRLGSAKAGYKQFLKPIVTTKIGRDLLKEPVLNKGTGFKTAERDAMKLRGLVPPRRLRMNLQLKKVMNLGDEYRNTNSALFTAAGLEGLVRGIGGGELAIDELNLDDCKVQAEAGEALGQLIGKCPQLRTVEGLPFSLKHLTLGACVA